MVINGCFERIDLLPTLLSSSQVGLEAFLKRHPVDLPADSRLAFRELGLSIGFRAVERLQGLIAGKPNLFNEKHFPCSLFENLLHHVSLGREIEAFWLEHANRETDNWKEYRDINMVMLATSLAPNGYLKI